MLRGVQVKFPQEASTVNSTIWLRELPLWTVDAVSDIIPFGQKARAAYLTYLLGAGVTGPRVELTGLESVLL